MTLKEIAEEAGVSISTVSRVLNKNNTKVARPEVQRRIRQIAEEAGYVPNISAQNLKSGTCERVKKAQKNIACIFTRTPDPVFNPFFVEMARSLERTAYQHDYVVKHSFTALDVRNSAMLQELCNKQVDGIAVLGRCNSELLYHLQRFFRYIVCSGLNRFDAAFDQVICDGYNVSLAVMEYLFELEHRNIAYIGETEHELRFTGYCDSLSKHGIPFRPDYVINVLQSAEDGYNGVNKLLEKTSDLTAIFCADDSTAIGAIRALHDHHIRVPEDISVISINDNESTQYLTPPLTTVHIPSTELGVMAAKVLIDRMEGGHEASR